MLALLAIWLLTLGYAVAYHGISKFAGSDRSFGQDLGASS